MSRLVVLLCVLSGLAASRQIIVFEDVTKSAGLSDALRGMMGHTAAWGDLDGDGRPDLFVAGFCDRPDSEYEPAKAPVPAALFRNLGNGKFERVKNSAAEFCGRSSGALFVDLDHDAFPELFVSNNAKGKVTETTEPQASAQKLRSKLYRNQKGAFQDISEASGASPDSLFTARNVIAFDYNGDGRIDLFVVEDRFLKGKKEARSILLKNLGGLKFQIANAEAGLPDDIHGLGAAAADLNQDGRPDIFIAHSNRLFLSGPNNRYHEAFHTEQNLAWTPSDNEDWPAGPAFGDLNGDGNLDLVIGIHHDPARNRLYLNRGIKNGEPVFEDITLKAGLAASIPTKSPHAEIQDFDNDGLPDIYFSAAWKTGGTVIPLIYHNEGVDRERIPHFTAIVEIKPGMIYFPAGPSADVNSDGKLDLFLVSWVPAEPSHLLMNRSSAGNWLEIRSPVGSQIKLTAGGKLIGMQQNYPGYGFASGQLPICHFGLGKYSHVDVEIKSPDGTTKVSKNVSANQLL